MNNDFTILNNPKYRATWFQTIILEVDIVITRLNQHWGWCSENNNCYFFYNRLCYTKGNQEQLFRTSLKNKKIPWDLNYNKKTKTLWRLEVNWKKLLVGQIYLGFWMLRIWLDLFTPRGLMHCFIAKDAQTAHFWFFGSV